MTAFGTPLWAASSVARDAWKYGESCTSVMRTCLPNSTESIRPTVRRFTLDVVLPVSTPPRYTPHAGRAERPRVSISRQDSETAALGPIAESAFNRTTHDTA